MNVSEEARHARVSGPRPKGHGPDEPYSTSRCTMTWYLPDQVPSPVRPSHARNRSPEGVCPGGATTEKRMAKSRAEDTRCAERATDVCWRNGIALHSWSKES